VTGRTKHVCANPDCKRKFRPVRADAEYCSNACKQAHYRARKKARAAAEAVFRVKQNAENFEDNKRTAVELRGKVKGLEVIATNTGVLVAETVPGARALAALMLPSWRETVCQPEDVPALLRRSVGPYRYSETKRAEREERSDRDFRYRAAERGFFFATRTPAHSITHFTYQPPTPITYPEFPAFMLPPRWSRCWEEDDRPVSEHEPTGVTGEEVPDEFFDPRGGDIQSVEDRSISDWLDADWDDSVTVNSDK